MSIKDSLVGSLAPEFPRGHKWINSPEFSLQDLRGKIVLIDFWTYSCVNCIRTLPFLKRWHKMYKDFGLIIIGVHTPEFEFEKNAGNVQRAVRGFEIAYPVVLDSDYKIWNLYANHWWPRKLLVDGYGKIIYDHIGEGGYEETETKIRKALGVEDQKPVSSTDGGPQPKVCYPQTPELYLGYERGYIGNPGGFERDRAVVYKDDKTPHKPNVVYLNGLWRVSREYIENARDSQEDYLTLNFEGTEANIVAEKIDGEGTAAVFLDGQKISEVKISFPEMINLVGRKNASSSLLRLEPRSAGLRLYALTFGGCL